MRIDWIYIKDFKNLRDFEMNFDENHPRAVIIGRNAVGKTNLLVALTQIFSDLDLKEKTPFGFSIHYRCNGHHIRISNIDKDKNPLRKIAFSVRDESLSDLEFQVKTEDEFYEFNSTTRILPRNIFGYYSGTSDRLRELFRKHEERHRDVLINQDDKQSLRYLFLAKPEHSQFVLLAFFAQADEKVRSFLKEHFGITGLDCALFVLREPYWSKTKISEKRKAAGDERFWFAGGKVKSLLSTLHSKALAPMRLQQPVRIGIKRKTTLEHVYCFLENEESVQALAEGIDQKELFRRLESTQLSDLLGKLLIFFELSDSKASLSFDDLSEGEQQLLTVLGLLRFTDEDESLFLLDEPDTHLNPAWCLDYLNILGDYGSDLKRSQLIMTTHNPIVFAGLTKSEVLVMRKDQFGKITAGHPSSDPKGKGFSAILTGDDLFGLQSILDGETLQEMEEKRRLATLSSRTSEQEERLQYLSHSLKFVEETNSIVHPLFRDFAEAMESELPQALVHPILTDEERQRRRQIAREILQRLRKEENDATH